MQEIDTTIATTMLESPRKRWTRTEYRRLIADEILQDGRVELVNGDIWIKIDKGRRHIAVVMRTMKVLGEIFGFMCVQNQSSLPVSEYGDPEPDIAVLALTLENYLEEEPTPADTRLVVEASDRTLRWDLTTKKEQYGSVGIPEYWVVSSCSESD